MTFRASRSSRNPAPSSIKPPRAPGNDVIGIVRVSVDERQDIGAQAWPPQIACHSVYENPISRRCHPRTQPLPSQDRCSPLTMSFTTFARVASNVSNASSRVLAPSFRRRAHRLAFASREITYVLCSCRCRTQLTRIAFCISGRPQARRRRRSSRRRAPV